MIDDHEPVARADYRRDLSTTRVGSSISIIHNGEDFAETTTNPGCALRALDCEIERIQARLSDLNGARAALVRHVREQIN
jgi:hypothetical protein